MIFSGNVFPIQKLPLKDKDEEWRKANVNHIISRRNSNYIDKQNRKDIIQINYDLLDSVYNERDLQLVANPYKVDDGFPATPQNFNVILPKINLLIGEESKRPFNFTVVETSDQATTMLQEKKKELLMQFVEAELQAQLGISNQQQPSQQDQNNAQQGQQNPMQQMTLTEIENYINREYKSIPEKLANTSLNYLKEKLNLPQEFLRGWRDALSSGEEIYWTGVINGDVFFERVNPLYCDFDKRPDLVFIEDGDWFLRHYRMSPASIYDRFFDMMDEDDLDRLQKMSDANYTMPMGGAQINWNPPVTFSVNNIKEVLLDVFHAVWKSYKKIGYLTYVDQDGQEQNMIVDETYHKLPEETLEWDWVIELWEGYRVGTDLYVGIKPLEYQSVSIDNPNARKLPYSGAIHGKSLVSIMKPLQYLYIVIWYRLELALARDKGKVVTMDITQIPKSMGIDVGKWMHYLSALGVNFINPYEEGWDIAGREGGKASQFNQISALDLSMSNIIEGYVKLLEKIEDMVGEISGVSRQRQGAIQTSELVGNVNRAVSQSALITEPLFWLHNQAKKNALHNLLNCAKYVWSVNPNKKLSYMVDDTTRAFMDITEDFLYSDYDIFVSDSTKEFQKLESLKTLMQPALQAGASLSEAATIITSDNIRVIQDKLADLDAKKAQAEQQQQQQQQQIQMQQMQQAQQQHQEEMQARAQEGQLKSDTAIEVAMIQAKTAQNTTDANNNGIPDVVDLQKIELDREKLLQKMQAENAKTAVQDKALNIESAKNRENARLKEKEIAVKRMTAHKKTTTK